MENIEIYKKTQELAAALAAMNGYMPHQNGDLSMFNSTNENTRASFYFDMAVIAQIHLCEHEMQDVIDDIEGDT